MPSKARLFAILFALPLVIGLAQAQDRMNTDKSPSLKVVGLYSLSADKEAYSRFIRETITFHDPANFSEEQKALFRRLGRGDSLHPFTDDDRKEWEDHLRSHMDEAAVLEVLVTTPDASFDIGKFFQPDPAQSENLWQAAWNEKFLTPDGETLISISTVPKSYPTHLSIASSLLSISGSQTNRCDPATGNWRFRHSSRCRNGCGVSRPMNSRLNTLGAYNARPHSTIGT